MVRSFEPCCNTRVSPSLTWDANPLIVSKSDGTGLFLGDGAGRSVGFVGGVGIVPAVSSSVVGSWAGVRDSLVGGV
jgi:hypothetical protein